MLGVLNEAQLHFFPAGSVASSIHGVARFTNDIDLVVEIDEGALARIAPKLGKWFYVDGSTTSAFAGRQP